jgi:hypothetical protein
LRFEFPKAPGHRDENLRPISWDEFFEKFDENNLELLYQEATAEGAPSNFNKLIHPESEKHSSHKTASSHTKATGSGTSSAKKSSGSASKKGTSGEKSGSASKSTASGSGASGAKKGAAQGKSHSSSRKHSAA